jgi:molybdopterin synthase sulfur carrier subunit
VPELLLTRALAAQTGGQLSYDVSPGTVREALDEVFAAYPLLQRYLLDDQGQLRQHVNVFVNEDLARDRRGLSDPIAEGDRIHVLQAVSGGTG